MASSIREKMVEQIRAAKKIAREAENAVKEGVKSASDKLKHIEAESRRKAAKASSGDSSEPSGKVRARTEKGHFVKDDPNTIENEAWVEEKPKKKAATKAPAKKRGRPRKQV
jgi:hypothetical protein